MKTTSKIILGSEIDDFDIKKGSLYVKINSNVIVMASQENGKSNQFCGMIVSGDLSGWGFGHYCTVWFKNTCSTSIPLKRQTNSTLKWLIDCP